MFLINLCSVIRVWSGGVSTPLPEWGGLKDLYAGIYNILGGLKGALRSGFSVTKAIPINKSYYCNSFQCEHTMMIRQQKIKIIETLL